MADEQNNPQAPVRATTANDALWSQAGGALRLAQAAEEAARAATHAARWNWALKLQLGRDGVMAIDRLFFTDPAPIDIKLFRASAEELAKPRETPLMSTAADTKEWNAAFAGQVRKSIELAKGIEGE